MQRSCDPRQPLTAALFEHAKKLRPLHACTVQSLLRTAEALGVQHVHVVESVCTFQLPAAEARTRCACSSPVHSRLQPCVIEAATLVYH